MSRTIRSDNGLNKGRDDKPIGSKCLSDNKHPKGYNSFENDHGLYSPKCSKKLKKMASRARRINSKNVVLDELNNGAIV